MNKKSVLFCYLIIFLLYCICFIRLPIEQTRISFILLCKIGTVIALGYIVCKYVNFWIGCFLYVALFSSIYPYYTKWSYIAFNNILIGILWYSLIVLFFDNKRIELLYNTFCIIALINVCQQILQINNMDYFYLANTVGEIRNKSPVGFMTNLNEISCLYALCFPAFLRKWWFIGLIPIGYGLWLVKLPSGFVAILIGLSFYILLTNWKWIILYTPLALLAYWLWIDKVNIPGIRQRLTLWKEVFKDALKHKWYGSGLSTWKDWLHFVDRLELKIWQRIKKADGEVFWEHIHNDILENYWEMGVGFIICLLGFILNNIRKINKQTVIPITAFFIIIFVSSIFFCWYIGVLAFIMLTWLAITEISLRRCV